MTEPELRIMNRPLLSWQSQVAQYPYSGPPGISYFAGWVDGYETPVDCLLWRDEAGRLRGILNHYPIDFPPWERAGNVNVWIRQSHQRQGIGTALVEECVRRWGLINYGQQQYTVAGASFARRLIEKQR